MCRVTLLFPAMPTSSECIAFLTVAAFASGLHLALSLADRFGMRSIPHGRGFRRMPPKKQPPGEMQASLPGAASLAAYGSLLRAYFKYDLSSMRSLW